MKRKRLIIVLFSLLAVVSLAALLWPREREPEYNGLTISKWLNRWANGQPEGFEDAIDHMGTNATPFILRALAYKKPRWKGWLVGSIQYWPDPLVNTRCVHWLLKDKSENRAYAAMYGFITLGPRAEPALPELRRLVNSKDSDTASRADICIFLITNRFNLDQVYLESLTSRISTTKKSLER